MLTGNAAPRSPVLHAAARNLGLGSWIGRDSKKFLNAAIAYLILSSIQLGHTH